MEREKSALLSSIKFSLKLGFVLFLTYLITLVLPIDIGYLGIIPREKYGLLGILTGPMVHGSWSHLLSNLPPLLVSVFLIHYFYKRQFWSIFLQSYILTGVMVWSFGRDVSHVGISGVVYALIAFIFWSGIFVRNLTSIILSLLVLVVYSGMFAGILPSPEIMAKNISWESHLLGGLVGIAVAWWQKGSIIAEHKAKEVPRSYSVDEPRQPYFPQDTFEKTRWQRYLEEQEASRREE
ncbi:MAG: rhomboid family intramembrane serine protease [Saprospiraceae bacterium]|nr:MAG: rhomboid family intramembrane serine protease [Saprospiraceae bacterium]